MNRNMEKNLIACMDGLEQGETVETVLARYPDDAVELRPYVETAAQMSSLASQPTIAAQQRSQAAFLEAAAALKNPQSAPPMPIWHTLRRLLLPVASLAAILFLLGFTLVTMSASALPGDGLYPVKREIEQFRLMRAADPEQILSLSEQIQQERLREIEALLRAGRTADVLFEGEIEAVDQAEWIVSGLPVQLDSETVIEGTPQVGELARIEGRTTDGRLFAAHISILTGSPDEDEPPRPAVVPTIVPTVEAIVTPLPDPEPDPTPPVTDDSQAAVPVISDDDMMSALRDEQPASNPPPAPSVVPTPETRNTDDGAGSDNNDNDDASNENSVSGDVGNDDGRDDGNNDSGDNNAGDDNNDNTGDDNNDNTGDDNNDNTGDDNNDNIGDDNNDNTGDDNNDNTGDDNNDNTGDNDNGDNDNTGNDNDNGDDNENSGDDNDNSGDEKDSGGDNDNDNGGDNDNGDDNDNNDNNHKDNNGNDNDENDNDSDDPGDKDGDSQSDNASVGTTMTILPTDRRSATTAH